MPIIFKMSTWFNCANWIRTMLVDNTADNTIFDFVFIIILTTVQSTYVIV